MPGGRTPGSRSHARTAAHSTEPTRRHFRISDDDIDALSGEYHEWRSRQNPGGVKIETSRKRIVVFIEYLASGGFFRQVGRTHGIAESTAHLYCKSVAEFFLAIAPDHISLPTVDELQDLGQQFGDSLVVLYVDGFICPIQRPDHAGDAYFCGRHGKTVDSLNAQIICDRRGNVRHVVAGPPGAAHDKTALEFSGEFQQFLEQLPLPYIVVGDAAYRGISPKLVVPFTGRNLTEEQQQHNYELSRLRQIVERCIGAKQVKWRMEQLKENRYAAKGGAEFAAMCIIACCVLHNRFSNYLTN